ncbi:putative mucoidy inhibitor-like protein [Zalerion maritima]|uniref:Mucoidy inhibitor-like protein n=1 Tax=Zalerion maritima TaxID=339359 RepID=A0AAD5RIB5_9PEZI|nr:putative mucoidy inhibitor-like protein [Zalerion maritima]
MDSRNQKHEYRVRDLPTRAVSLFASRAQVVRDIKNVPLKSGVNEITIVGLTPSIDEQSIKVEGTGSAIITDIAVESLPNREIFEEIYPDSDDDDSSDTDSSDSPDEAPEPVKLDDIPKSEELKDVQAKLTSLRDERRRTDEVLASSESRQKWLDAYYKTLSNAGGFGEQAAKEIDVGDAMGTYDTERKKVFATHMEAKIRKRDIDQEIAELVKEEAKYEKERKKELKEMGKERQKILKALEKSRRLKIKEETKGKRKEAERQKEKLRIRKERESFWPKTCFTVRIKLDAVDFTPISSRRSSFAGDLVKAAPEKSPTDEAACPPSSCDLSLTYVTAYAYWSPKYDLQLSTTNNTGLLCFDAELTNLTSETWSDCKVTLSTSQTTTTSLNEVIPALVPWHVKLVGRHAALGNLDGSPNGDIINSREERLHKQSWQHRNNIVNVVQKPRAEMFGPQNSNSVFGNKASKWAHQAPQQQMLSQLGGPPPPPQGASAVGAGNQNTGGYTQNAAFGKGMNTSLFSDFREKQPPSGSGLFGNNASRDRSGSDNNGFGSSVFPNPVSNYEASSVFAGASSFRGPPGTTMTAFKAHLETEPGFPRITTVFHHMGRQAEYSGWSAEELRLADYDQGVRNVRRFGDAPRSGPSGIKPATGGGLFGSSNANSTSSGFGTATNTHNYATASLFGAPRPTTNTSGSGFGAFSNTNNTGSGLFGSNKANATSNANMTSGGLISDGGAQATIISSSSGGLPFGSAVSSTPRGGRGGGLFGGIPPLNQNQRDAKTENQETGQITGWNSNSISVAPAPTGGSMPQASLKKSKKVATRGRGGFGGLGSTAAAGGDNDGEEEEDDADEDALDLVPEMDEITLNPNRELDFQESSFEETGLTTTYDLPGNKTLAPSTTSSKQRVARIQFAGVIFSHTVVAKYRPAAYLKAKMKNGSKITLLKGPSGLTLDGSFMGRTTLPRCSAGEAFTLPLGVDPAIKVAYPKPDIQRITTGFFAKEDSSIYTRTVTVANTRSSAGKPVNLLVLDQVPVSEDEKLRVEVLNPKGLAVGGNTVSTGIAMKEGESKKDWGKATAHLKKGGEITWEVSLNAGKAVKLNLDGAMVVKESEGASWMEESDCYDDNSSQLATDDDGRGKGRFLKPPRLDGKGGGSGGRMLRKLGSFGSLKSGKRGDRAAANTKKNDDDGDNAGVPSSSGKTGKKPARVASLLGGFGELKASLKNKGD